jgi:hypothetical protein
MSYLVLCPFPFSDSYFISLLVIGVLICKGAYVFILKGNTGIVKSRSPSSRLRNILKKKKRKKKAI